MMIAMSDYITICEKAVRLGGAVVLDWIGRIEATEKAPKKATKKTSSSIPTEIRANLLPNLVVGVDNCYVFLRAHENSQFFGPLVKGENIKRIETYKYWTQVWIPRLRISGWVRKYKVYISARKTPDEESIPTELLNTLSIVKKRVNIRKAASTRAPIIHKAKQRQEFVILDEKKGWYQIWVPRIEKKGWVSATVAVKQRKG